MSQQSGPSGGGGAAATIATTVDQSSPSTSRWHSKMQKDRMATKAELLEYRRVYEQVLFVDIPSYYKRPGRYQQVDTARIIELNNILNDLFYGKTPDAHTHEMMIAGDYTKMKGGATKRNLEHWAKSHPDVRAKKKTKDAKRQSTLLEYAFHAVGSIGNSVERTSAVGRRWLSIAAK
jgi:hypothetical protein